MNKQNNLSTPAGAPLEHHDAYQVARDYWLARVPLLPPAPELPVLASFSTAHHPLKRRRARFDVGAWQSLQEKATAFKLDPEAVLLSAFAEVAAMWSKHAHFLIKLGLPDVPGRGARESGVVNLFEIDNTKGKTFETRTRHQQQQLGHDLEHSEFGGREVVREIARVQGTGSQSVAPVVFISFIGGVAEAKAAFLNRLPDNNDYLAAIVEEDQGALTVQWDSADAIFPPDLIDDMFAAYTALLRQLATEESAWHRTFAENTRQLLPEKQTKLLQDVNRTAAPGSEEFLHTLFLKQVAERPGHVAVNTPTRRMSYGEVYARACRIEEELLPRGLEPNQLVGIVMEKGWEQVVAVLGVLFAGGAYMPIDPELPSERQRYLIENGDVKVVLTQSAVRHRVSVPDEVEILAVDQMEPLEGRPLTPRARQKREDLAYVIYTSGSTGQPKGVMIDHCGAVNTVLDINQRFGVGPDDRVLAVSRLDFDLSVYDIFGLLAAGGTVVMPSADRAQDIAHWVHQVAAEKVTLWNSVPSLMSLMVERVAGGESLGDSLRLVMLSGDWIPVGLPGQIRKLLPKATIISMGGATEASIWSILYPINQVDPTWKSIPYGQPMRNQTFSVLNEAQAPCPVWVPGQLYIGGMGLARGYWRDARKTHASFIHHASGERLYRTGDWGRYLPDGNIEFLGREDAQVKLYGYRIELGEIEAKLRRHEAVENCAVVVREDISGGRQLAGYVILKTGARVEAAALREFLLTKLPEYMVPQAFVFVDQFPLTANGKVDRKSLPLKSPAPIATQP